MTYPNKNFMVDSSCFVVAPFSLVFSFELKCSLFTPCFPPPHTQPSFIRSGSRRKTFSAFFEYLAVLYVLPRQRAYRSVQTTKFMAWTWISFLMLFPSTSLFRFPSSPFPSALLFPFSFFLSSLESFPTHAAEKTFFFPNAFYVILRNWW